MQAFKFFSILCTMSERCGRRLHRGSQKARGTQMGTASVAAPIPLSKHPTEATQGTGGRLASRFGTWFTRAGRSRSSWSPGISHQEQREMNAGVQLTFSLLLFIYFLLSLWDLSPCCGTIHIQGGSSLIRRISLETSPQMPRGVSPKRLCPIG